MFKTDYCKMDGGNRIFNACPLVLRAVICVAVIGTIALPAGAVSQQASSANEKTSAPGSSPMSDESATLEKEDEKTGYFRFNLSGAFGRYRYKEDWNNADEPAIRRYQGPGVQAMFDVGLQRKSGFAFGAAFQLGLFPALNQFRKNEELVARENETENIKFVIAGLLFLHHPFGVQNGYYFAIRTGVSLMHGVPNYLPYPIPGFSVSTGYDFLKKAKAHLGLEAKVTTIFGRGGADGDFSGMEMKARLISFGLAFTVAVY